MDFPQHCITLIEELAHKESLKAHYSELSNRYRHAEDKALRNDKEHLAYLACRMPATFAVNCEVIARLKEILPSFAPKTVLDVGSGPATSVLALLEYLPLEQVVCVERDQTFISYAKQFLAPYTLASSWTKSLPDEGAFDLVISSYMLSELDPGHFETMCQAMMQRSKEFVIFIDTGTPKGFQAIARARDLLRQQFHLLAPCPHNGPCPMAAGDWCHFSSRLPRSRLHRQVKGVDRGFEDEKFCYLVASKTKHSPVPADRILSQPIKRSGHVHLKLCTREGEICQKIVSKRTKEQYDQAKRAQWGFHLRDL